MSRSTWVVINAALRTFAYRAFTFYGWPFQAYSASSRVCNCVSISQNAENDSRNTMLKTAATLQQHGLGCSRFARRYSGNRDFFLLLGVLSCFSSPGSLRTAYGFSSGYWGISPSGLPHSEIHGSKPACGSPWLFVARYVLRRLPAPRHPPCALNSLTFKSAVKLKISFAYIASCAVVKELGRLRQNLPQNNP